MYKTDASNNDNPLKKCNDYDGCHMGLGCTASFFGGLVVGVCLTLLITGCCYKQNKKIRNSESFLPPATSQATNPSSAQYQHPPTNQPQINNYYRPNSQGSQECGET